MDKKQEQELLKIIENAKELHQQLMEQFEKMKKKVKSTSINCANDPTNDSAVFENKKAVEEGNYIYDAIRFSEVLLKHLTKIDV